MQELYDTVQKIKQRWLERFVVFYSIYRNRFSVVNREYQLVHLSVVIYAVICVAFINRKVAGHIFDFIKCEHQPAWFYIYLCSRSKSWINITDETDTCRLFDCMSAVYPQLIFMSFICVICPILHSRVYWLLLVVEMV